MDCKLKIIAMMLTDAKKFQLTSSKFQH